MAKKIFIIGYSGIGKTTYKNKLAGIISDANLIEMSDALGPVSKEAMDNRAEVLTGISIGLLRENHLYFSGWLKDRIVEGKTNIISGIRNPDDFINNYDRYNDEVVFLDGGVASTEFERLGIDAIKKYVEFANLFA